MSKQRVVITIGHTQILLPDDTGAATVVKALSRGTEVYHFDHSRKVRLLGGEGMTVGLHYLPPNTMFEDEHQQPVELDPPKKGRGKPALRAPKQFALPAPREGLL